jgi:hypothetical protein
MKLTLVHRPSVQASASPYRLLDEHGQEVVWANVFLDAQRIRQLSLRSLRAYAYDLLHFARWFQNPPRNLSDLTESTLLVSSAKRKLVVKRPPSPGDIHDGGRRSQMSSRYHVRLAACACCFPLTQRALRAAAPM